jgi:hypothetical protein
MSLSSDLFASERFAATRRPIREASTLQQDNRVLGPTANATSGGSVQTWGWRKLPADVGRFGR